MQTSMQKLIKWGDKMMKDYPMKELGFGQVIDKAVELLEMEKQQIMNAYEDGDINGYKSGVVRNNSSSDISPEQYFAETYGSKGSDEIKLPTQDDKIGSHIFDTYSIKQAKDDDINQLTSNSVDYQNSTNMSNNIAEFNYRMNKRISNYLSTLPISSQTEISDEEIEEMLFHHSNEYSIGFKDAIKWYREQLKSKQ